MAANDNLQIPNRELVDFLYNGIIVFHPRVLIEAGETLKDDLPDKTFKENPHLQQIEPNNFDSFLFKHTGVRDFKSAYEKVVEWKKTYEKAEEIADPQQKEEYLNTQLPHTVPPNINELVDELEDKSKSKDYSVFDIRTSVDNLIKEKTKDTTVYKKPLPTPEPPLTESVTPAATTVLPEEIQETPAEEEHIFPPPRPEVEVQLRPFVVKINNSSKEEVVNDPELQNIIGASVAGGLTDSSQALVKTILNDLWEEIQGVDADTFIKNTRESTDPKYLIARAAVADPDITSKKIDLAKFPSSQNQYQEFYISSQSPYSSPSDETKIVQEDLRRLALSTEKDEFTFKVLQNKEFLANIEENVKVEISNLPPEEALAQFVGSLWSEFKGGNNTDAMTRAIAGEDIDITISDKPTANPLARFSLKKSYVSKIADKFAAFKDIESSELFRIGAEFIDPTKVSVSRAAPQLAALGIRFTYGLGLEAFGKDYPAEATVWYLFSQGIGHKQLNAFADELKANNVSDKQIAIIRQYGSVLQTLQGQHTYMNRVFQWAYRGRKLGYVPDEKGIQADFSFTGNGFSAIVERKYFEGGSGTKIFRQFAGEASVRLLKRTLSPLTSKFKKAFLKGAASFATKTTAKLGLEAVATGATGGIAAAVIAAGTILSKIAKKIPGVGWFLKKVRKNWKVAGAGLIGLMFLLPTAIVGSILTIAVPVAIAGTFIWGLGTLGAAAGVVGSSVTFFMGGLSLIGAEIAKALAYAFAILAGITVIIAFIIYIITASSYMVPPAPRPGGTYNQAYGVIRESQYIGIEKIPSPTGPFRNTDLAGGLEVTYSITVTAKRGSLTNIRFENEYIVTQEVSRAITPNPPIPDPPGTILANESFTFEYTVSYDEGFADSIVTDNFTVRADTEDIQDDYAISFASIVIGEPPMDCPSGWPVLVNNGQTYVVQQGPEGTATHQGREAIDVHYEPFTTETIDNAYVVSTHNGTLLHQAIDRWGGLYVSTRSTCNGAEFMSWHVHFSSFSVNFEPGDFIPRGTILGIMGHTGSATYIHDHYEFRALGDHNNGGPATVWPTPVQMIHPFVPVTVPRECVGNCNIYIP